MMHPLPSSLPHPPPIPPPAHLFSRARMTLANATIHSHGTPAMLSLASFPFPPPTLALKAALREQGHVPGMCYMASRYLQTNDLSIANTLFMLCARTNCSLALHMLGRLAEHNSSPLAPWYYRLSWDAGGGEEVAMRLGGWFERNSRPNCAKSVYRIVSECGGSAGEAMWRLGRLLVLGGEGIEGKLWIERAVETRGGRRELGWLACLYQYGRSGVERDIGMALEVYGRILEEYGESWVPACMAQLLFETEDEADRIRAIDYLELGVEEDDPEAMNLLADICIDQGDNVRARELYERVLWTAERKVLENVRLDLAALIGFTEDEMVRDEVRAQMLLETTLEECTGGGLRAIKMLALLYEKLDDDNTRAQWLWEEGWERFRDAECASMLAKAMAKSGNKKKFEQAISLFEDSIQNGYLYAKFNLAMALCDESNCTSVYGDRGRSLLEEVIMQYGDISALIELARFHRFGMLGLQKDTTEAVHLYERAIALGLDNEQSELDKLGIEMDLTECMGTYSDVMSIRQHNIERRVHVKAMFDLAETLVMEVLPPNAERAISLLERSLWDSRATYGYRNVDVSDEMITKIWKLTAGSETLRKRLIAVLERLVGRTGMRSCMRFLGSLYLKGDEFVEKDISRGKFMYEKAVFNDDTEGMIAYAKLLEAGLLGMKHERKRALGLFLKAVRHEDEMNMKAILHIAGLMVEQLELKQTKKADCIEHTSDCSVEAETEE